MTTRLYLGIVAGVSAVLVVCVLLVAGLRLRALHSPIRPAKLPASAVWRPTPTEHARLLPHGDWIACKQEGTQDRCAVTDAFGNLEYEGVFIPIPQNRTVPDARLLPVTSDTLSPWMWSDHANRLVPVIDLEDGTVLAPAESVADLRSYVERMKKFTAVSPPLPSGLSYHPAGGPVPDKR